MPKNWTWRKNFIINTLKTFWAGDPDDRQRVVCRDDTLEQLREQFGLVQCHCQETRDGRRHDYARNCENHLKGVGPSS